MRGFLHSIYVFAGKLLCNCSLVYWEIRDKISPPKADSILLVAHPDDDTLFFHTFIKEHKPYVVLLFTGWSLRRLPDYKKTMKYYGVRFRAYATVSDGAYYDSNRREVTKKHIRKCLNLGSFKTIAFHNAAGEYGHNTHKLVHEAVIEVCSEIKENHELLCPVKLPEIGNYPLSEKEKQDKKYIFENFYVTEKWVMTQEEAGTPIWFNNERLEKIDGNIARNTAL